jgi:Trk K+ transport system NAD-binding subunit
VNVAAVVRSHGLDPRVPLNELDRVNFIPSPDDLMREGDILLLIGHEHDLARFQEEQ